jgi:hypothetical protein
MQTSGASRREVASACLDLALLFENCEVGVCAKLICLAPRNAPVMPGLDPGIHNLRNKPFSKKMDRRVKRGDDAFNW